MKNVLTCDTRKIVVAVCMMVVLLFGMVDQAEAAEIKADSIVLYMGETEMYAGDKAVSLGNSVPVMNNGRVYVPLRAIAESFGAKIEYDKKTGDITLTQNGKTVIMNTKASAFSVNGELRWMDVAPYINSQSRTMVPVRFISDGLGYEINLTTNDRGKVVSLAIDRVDQ